MLSDDMKLMVESYYHDLLRDGNDMQVEFIDELIRLAAQEDVALHLQDNQYQAAILNEIMNIDTTSEPRIKDRALNLWNKIKEMFQKDTLINQQKSHQNAMEIRDNRIALHEHTNKKNVWLNNDHIERLMPKESKSFVVLAPIRQDALSSIDIEAYINNQAVQSIVLPVGPGHWRLVHLEKSSQGDVSVSIFDSFGKSSAKHIEEPIKQWLTENNLLNVTISYDEPKNRQTDGYSCGDFVVAQAHTIARRAHAEYNDDFVRALETKQPLRELMIKQSRANKWQALLEKGPKKAENLSEGQRIIDYETSPGKTVQVDEETQIELDRILAERLQEEYNEESNNSNRP